MSMLSWNFYYKTLSSSYSFSTVGHKKKKEHSVFFVFKSLQADIKQQSSEKCVFFKFMQKMLAEGSVFKLKCTITLKYMKIQS